MVVCVFSFFPHLFVFSQFSMAFAASKPLVEIPVAGFAPVQVTTDYFEISVPYFVFCLACYLARKSNLVRSAATFNWFEGKARKDCELPTTDKRASSHSNNNDFDLSRVARLLFGRKQKSSL